jgi:hypothetical protein
MAGDPLFFLYPVAFLVCFGKRAGMEAAEWLRLIADAAESRRFMMPPGIQS